MAVKFEFVSALICERVLREADGVSSAIRIVDVFYVPEDAPEGAAIQFYAFVALRGTIPDPIPDVTVGVTLIRTNGERVPMPAPAEPIKPSRFEDDPSIPGGITLVTQINLVPKNMGTCYLEIDADGKVVAKLPFTVRRPAPQSKN